MTATTTAPIQGIRFATAREHRAEMLPAGTEVRITRRGAYWVARDTAGFCSGRMTWAALNAAAALD